MQASLLDGLNPQQQQAVSAPLSNLLVLAGAGSGKTRVLTHRIAWLIQEQQQGPHSILAVTFTNKAAKEMRSRIEAIMGAQHQSMWVGTFHSLAHRLLRMHCREINLPDNFQIIDSDDQLRMIKRVIKNLNLDDKRWPAKQAQGYINGNKDEGLYPQNIECRTQADVTWLKIYQGYQDQCDRSGLIDFADLLLKAHQLWVQCPHILEHYQDRFRHILVDEFQDTNAIQYAWIRLLAQKQGHVMIVGDDDQSIYGWRGAQIENLDRFLTDFEDAQTIRLEQNYRSTANILNASNALIANNPERMGKELWTQGQDGAKISLYEGFNEIDEARFIAQEIRKWQSQGQALSNLAILYRSNAQSRVLEEALMRENLPYRIYGGMRFFDRQEVKDAVAYLRLIAHRDDDAAFERVINTPPRGLGQRTLDTLRAFAQQHQIPMWQACLQVISEGALPARAATALASFVDLINQMSAACQEASLAHTVDHTIKTSGLFAMYQQEKGEKSKSRLENLAELITAADAFEQVEVEDEVMQDLDELTAFLTYAALESSERQADPDQVAVQLMTLHAAKGLEFPVVFIAGAEDGLFPSQQAIDFDDRLDEERRLCYVGMTRAEQKLYFTYTNARRIYGRVQNHRMSRFIEEIPPQFMEKIKLNNRSAPAAPKPKFRNTDVALVDGLKLGQQVAHPKFGRGVIIGYDGAAQSMRIHVNFEIHGAKWLVQAYARLEPV